MKCIFCAVESGNSRSVEHIIPESLGNSTHKLPRGVVCDKCNNYFSREVEKPFLAWPSIRSLRFEQLIPNKDKRIPSLPGILLPGWDASLERDPSGDTRMIVDLGFLKSAAVGQTLTFLTTTATDDVPPITSRFLAKVALEAMALRLLDATDVSIDIALLDKQLDPVRDHARRGRFTQWPINVRRIYDQMANWTDDGRTEFQVLHEFDFLVTDEQEWFFVLCLFGLEMAINIGAPEIDGYHAWLERHALVSPLFHGKNASGSRYQGVKTDHAYWPLRGQGNSGPKPKSLG